MKATINELWETGRMIISFDDSDVCRPSSIAELKKCENVLVGNRIDGPKSPYEVLIDNSIQMVMPTTTNHPYGGKMYILEVY